MSEIRERHTRIEVAKVSSQQPGDWCSPCLTLWPCDAIQQADEALMWKQTAQRVGDALTEQVKRLTADVECEAGIAQAARADADRLAEALEVYYDCSQADNRPGFHDREQARDALRQHDEATE